MKKIMILSNGVKIIYNFRRELIEKLINDKAKVVIIAPFGERTEYFRKLGCEVIDIKIDRRGTNPITDLQLLHKYKKLIKGKRPDVVLTYTIKPNVYGGLACRLTKTTYITNVTGLGSAIQNSGFTQKLALWLYRVGLKNASCVFFQNVPNSELFKHKEIVKNNIHLIPGSGVNIKEHEFEEYPDDDGTIRFLFIGRIMKEKGINELLEAAKKVKRKYPSTYFDLVGELEEDYSDKLDELEKEGIIKYHGIQANVHTFIKNSHATVLPSYHEGIANVLLETASAGRPVIASNVTGCVETFDEGITGLGFEVRNVDDLADKLIMFIKLSYEKKKIMGIAGRKKMEKEFDRNIVINDYMDEIMKVTNNI